MKTFHLSIPIRLGVPTTTIALFRWCRGTCWSRVQRNVKISSRANGRSCITCRKPFRHTNTLRLTWWMLRFVRSAISISVSRRLTSVPFVISFVIKCVRLIRWAWHSLKAYIWIVNLRWQSQSVIKERRQKKKNVFNSSFVTAAVS